MNVKRLFETFEPKKYKLFLDLSRAEERDFSGKVKVSGVPKNERSMLKI